MYPAPEGEAFFARSALRRIEHSDGLQTHDDGEVTHLYA